MVESSDLKNSRGGLVPLLSLSPLPGAEKREADLAAVVEVGVEPHLAVASRPEVDLRRDGEVKL